MALAIPHRIGHSKAAWSPAATPRRTCPSDTRADSPMMLMSAMSATAKPAPTATPLMADTTGLSALSMHSTMARASRHCSSRAP